MKVKIGNMLFDSEKEPIMLIMSLEDKSNIANMQPGADVYCAYPKDMDQEKIKEWMRK